MLKNFTSTDAWCPPKNDENQYLQVDLSRKTEVTKVATQGQIGSKDRHVKTYALLYSDDGKKWQQYSSKGKEKVRLLFRYHSVDSETPRCILRTRGLGLCACLYTNMDLLMFIINDD